MTYTTEIVVSTIAAVSIVLAASLQLQWGKYYPPVHSEMFCGPSKPTGESGSKSKTQTYPKCMNSSMTGYMLWCVLALFLGAHAWVAGLFWQEYDDFDITKVTGYATVGVTNTSLDANYKAALDLYVTRMELLNKYVIYWTIFSGTELFFEIFVVHFQEVLDEVANHRTANGQGYSLKNIRRAFGLHLLFISKRLGACLGLIAAALAFTQQSLLDHILCTKAHIAAGGFPKALYDYNKEDTNFTMLFEWIIIFGVSWCVLNAVLYTTTNQENRAQQSYIVNAKATAAAANVQAPLATMGMLQLGGQAVTHRNPC